MSSLNKIDQVLSQSVQAGDVPGVVAMAATDKGVVYEGAYGKRELGKDAPMTLDTVVWIASMTKAITCTAAMQLVERGKVKLEQPASEIVPQLSEKLTKRGIPGVVLDLEPHLKGGGQFGGTSGPDGMGVALRSLCRVLDHVGLAYHLRDFDDVRAARGY